MEINYNDGFSAISHSICWSVFQSTFLYSSVCNLKSLKTVDYTFKYPLSEFVIEFGSSPSDLHFIKPSQLIITKVRYLIMPRATPGQAPLGELELHQAPIEK